MSEKKYKKLWELNATEKVPIDTIFREKPHVRFDTEYIEISAYKELLTEARKLREILSIVTLEGCSNDFTRCIPCDAKEALSDFDAKYPNEENKV